MLSYDNALAHQTRSLIHDIIIDRPGLTFTEIMNNLKIKESTLRYHLRYLEKREIVRTKEKKGRKFYFPSIEETVMGTDRTLSRVQFLILREIEKDPGLDQKTLASRIKKNRFLSSYNLKRLQDMGLIRKKRDGKRVRYFRLSREELKKRILKEIIDELIDGDIDEERYLELRKELDQL
jgi:predicted transcriptional regulator